MISLRLNEAQAEWGAATLTRIVEGVATGGLALPELMAVSFVEYMTTVQGLTPPAKGARVIGSVDLSRGKAAINVDLGRAFVVVAKGVVTSLPGTKLLGKAGGAVAKASTRVGRKVAAQVSRVASLSRAKRLGRIAAAQVQAGAVAAAKKVKSEVLSAADENPESWYNKQRRNGRFVGRVKMEIDRTHLENIRRSLHARVGYLASGWNAAAARFKVPTPSWVSSKGGRGSVAVTRSSSKLNIQAANQVAYSNDIAGMQRRINAAGEIVAKRMERKAALAAEKAMQQQIDK